MTASPAEPTSISGLRPQPVDEPDGDEGEDQVDRAGDDDVEQDVADAVAGGREDLLGVVEDDVDAAPLLEDGQDDADDEDLAACPARAGRGSRTRPVSSAASVASDLGQGLRRRKPVPPIRARIVSGLAPRGRS